MMAMRRWLTAQYDWTGLSKRTYTSKSWVVAMLILAVVIVVVLAAILRGPMITTEVALNTFAPVEIIHAADLVLAGVLGFFLLTNLARMYAMVMGNEGRVPLKVYISEAWNLVVHLVTQKRFSECGNSQLRWVNHLIIVAGYGTMFLLIVVFLSWFQTDNVYPIYHPQRIIGYLAAAALIYGGVDAVVGRIRKRHQMHKYSHASDWLFPILLILLATSGLVISFARTSGLPLATYYSYVIHLAIMMMLYVTVGPMGKWAHLIYRPFAIYFQAVKARAREIQIELNAEPTAAD
jgi:nitrate reductase gamma subunit